MGRQAAARRTIARVSPGERHIWVPKMPYFETPAAFPAKAPFVGFLASKHGQSLPARAPRKRPIGDVTL